MNELDRLAVDDRTCPKRVWVMSTLSDDEAFEATDALPHGLAFHLSRCDPCRALAHRLLSVTGSLRDLAALEPKPGLAEGAHCRVLAALRDGGRLTGRVRIPVDLVADTAPLRPAGRPGLLRCAAAAVIVLAVGVSAGLTWLGTSDRTNEPVKPNRVPHLTSRAAPVLPGAMHTPQPPASTARVADRREEQGPTASEKVVGAAHAAVEPLVGPEAPKPSDALTPRLCRHRSSLEAARRDNPHGVHTAVVLPRQALKAARKPD